MKKEEIIIELVKSLNMGSSGYREDRVHNAIAQYNQLIDRGIIKGENTDDGENS